MAAGGWAWGATVAAIFTYVLRTDISGKLGELTGIRYDFTQRGIPVLQHYLEERVSDCCLPIHLFILADFDCSMVTNTPAMKTPSLTSSCHMCGRMVACWHPGTGPEDMSISILL